MERVSLDTSGVNSSATSSAASSPTDSYGSAVTTARASSWWLSRAKAEASVPPCNAKRAHLTAAHLVDNVLPQVPYRQWTFSFPWKLRLALARDDKLLSSVLTLCLRALFSLQRRRARRLGAHAKAGVITFVQRFGSALQLTPHFHVVAPDGVFAEKGNGIRFIPLAAPSQEDVERLLKRVRRKVLKVLEEKGVLMVEEEPEDGLGMFQAASLQQRFRWPELDVRPPPRKKPRCAFIEGFSLHANTHLHENDRAGLERLCRYGARGALALERLESLSDGRVSFRMKRPLPDGRTHLVFTQVELLRKLATLVPPPRSNLVRFHGVFAPGAKLRPFLLSQAPAHAAPVPSVSANAGTSAARSASGSTDEPPTRTGVANAGVANRIGSTEGAQTARAPLDWADLLRRTFAIEVLQCGRCGGKRRVLAHVTGTGAKAFLDHLGLPSRPPPLAPARGPPEPTWLH